MRFWTFARRRRSAVRHRRRRLRCTTRLGQRREDQSIGQKYRPIPKYSVGQLRSDWCILIRLGAPLDILWKDAMKKTTAPIPFAGSQLGETRHVCAFFNSDDEEYRVLLPFIKDGFQCGHRAIHVVNPDQRHDHLQRLAAVGIDAPAAEQSGQLEVRINTDVYLPDGRFDPGRMIAVFEKLASGNAGGQFPLSRICCRMDWAVEDQSYVDDVIEFESRVNEVWRRHDDAVICTYHL